MKKVLSLALLITFVISASAQQWGMYTLYATKNGTAGYLCDTNGTNYKTWTFSSSKKSAYSAYLIPGDTLVRSYKPTANTSWNSGGIHGGIQKLSWNGTATWDFTYYGSTYCAHHDICPMPNGNILLISYETKTSAEATQAGCSSATTLWAEKIVELKQTGPTTYTTVWEWHLWDHLCQNYNSAKDNYVTSIVNNPQLLNINYGSGTDRWHMNGLDYNADLDQIAISMHFMNSVFIIDHSTTTAEAADHTGGNSGKGGDFLYRWGNPASYSASGTTVFQTIHDAHWISADHPLYPNYLCGFNNEGGTGGKSAVTIFNPPYNGYNYTQPAAGQAFAPAAYAYQYTSGFTATNESNSQQLDNGNMLVNNAFGSVYEVNSAGTQLWTKSTNSTHCYRYSLCYVRGPIASATASPTTVSAGSPVNLSSSAVSPTETSPTYSYAWSSGDNTQNATVYPTGNTTYIVTITNTALGCSDTASVTVQVTTGVDDGLLNNELTVYPNPTNGILNISNGLPQTDYTVSVFDQLGKVIIQEKNVIAVDLSQYKNGIYFLSVKTASKTYMTRKIILLK
ncbi:MAG: T9SS type A sorting domain-containing protein [Bacteroidota bacterium]